MGNPIQVVIDTNVFVAALKSEQGASAELFSTLPNPKWENNISSALLLEFEEKAKDPRLSILKSFGEIEEILDKIVSASNCQVIRKPRQPRSKDPDDDFLLDLADAAKVEIIITFNVRNFVEARKSGIEVMRPGDFLRYIQTL